MNEPDRKRRRFQNTVVEYDTNSGPGPPRDYGVDQNSSNVPLDEARLCTETLSQLLSTNCICPWGLENFEKVFVPFGRAVVQNEFECEDDALLFCSVCQILCEEMSASRFSEKGQNLKCCSLRRLQKFVFVLNSATDISPYLIYFLKSPIRFVSYAAGKALAAWLKSADDGACRLLLDRLLDNIIGPLGRSLSILNSSATPGPLPHTVSHLLDFLHSCIENADTESHPTEGATEEDSPQGVSSAPGSHRVCSGNATMSCEEHLETEVDHDSKDLKGNVIRALGKHWNVIVTHFHAALSLSSGGEKFPLVSFLTLWRSTISVKANVSILDTKPFYARQESLLPLMTPSLDEILWREILNLFNEVLCYGSTLALQDFLPDEPCNLAHLLIRHVKNDRLLEQAPVNRDLANTNGQKSLMQKLVLLVLKAIAVTVKETRCESSSLESESSSESGRSEQISEEDTEDLHADMTVILRSIKQVLRVLDARVKVWLPFHPETLMSEWMVKLFGDQDDALVEAMLCTLDINNGLYNNCRGLNSTSATLHCGLKELKETLNPVQTWFKFLETVSFDPDVLLDLLVSNETCFLLYLLRFLKFIRRNWSDFLEALTFRQLEDTMTCFIRLRIAIRRLVAKNLFPYNIGPIVKLLEKCEGLYEGQEN